NSFRFGLLTRSPDTEKTKGEALKLTFSNYGLTNSTVLKINGGKDRIYGMPKAGEERWLEDKKPFKKYPQPKVVMRFEPEGIEIPQHVKRVVGDEYALSPSGKQIEDTALVVYEIHNTTDQSKKKETHTVSLRFLLDTFIGSNDETYFTIPGVKDMV